jgi:hypothetical protein
MRPLDWKGQYTGRRISLDFKATLCSAALEMVHQLHLSDGPEHEYAKIVFLCMVCSIVLGIFTASTWVGIYGKVPIGLGPEEKSEFLAT